MSRGLGKRQLLILDRLADGRLHTAYELAGGGWWPATAHLPRYHPTAAELRSTRRAIANLHKRGLIERVWYDFEGSLAGMWPGDGRGLAVWAWRLQQSDEHST